MAGVQVVRVESYTKAAMSGVGREQLRVATSVCRNADIDPSRTGLNVALKSPAGGSIGSAWHTSFDDINPGYKARRDGGVMDQMIVTSGPAFFAEMGWTPGLGMTPQMDRFFQDAYNWAVAQVGFQGSDRNILAATVHLDETTPHMHIAYIPIAEKRRIVVYEKDENGATRRNAKGSPIKAKDAHGKVIYKISEEPRLSHTEFWGFYGGEESEYVTGRRNISYSLLQDSFHTDVGKRWGLGRGEIGSDARHESHHKRRTKKAKRELKAVQEQTEKAVQAHENVQKETASLTAKRDELDAGIEIRTSEITALDESIVAKKNELSSVQSDVKTARTDLKAAQRSAAQEREKLLSEKQDWESGSKDRIAEVSSLNKSIAEKRQELSSVEERLGDVASAADLQQAALPGGKVSLSGRKVTYTSDENAQLRRLANTGLVSHRLDQWYRNEHQKRQAAETQVVQLKSTVSRLKSDVEELMPYKDKAERIPELEMELETVKAELQEEKKWNQSLLCQIEALKSIILDLAGAFAAKFRGALDFIRDHVRKKAPRLAKQIVPRPDVSADIDAYIARTERDRAQAKRQNNDFER